MADGGDIVEGMPRVKLAILQRVVTPYRLALFRRLAEEPQVDLRILAGSDLPDSKVRNAADLSALDVEQLPTRFLRIGGRVLTWHRGLQAALRRFGPDAILCEGESNLLSALGALWFRWRRPSVAVLHWSLGGLPGEPVRKTGLRGRAINAFRRRFDAFVVYSSYGKDVLVANGADPDRVFVATNVSDLARHAEAAGRIDRESAREALGVDDRFMVLFVGAMTPAKRLDVLLEAVSDLDPARFQVVIAGDGEVREELLAESSRRGLSHVDFPGRIGSGIENYYRAADLVALPGRGGMVISEAMAYGRPIVAFHADGTEYDLVIDGETGIRMRRGDAEELRSAIESMAGDRSTAERMGREAQRVLFERFGVAQMIDQIESAISCAIAHRGLRH